MLAQKKTKNYTIDMCEGSILKKLLLFALPLIASSILQLFFNAADVIVVGKFAGDHALAAVGSNGSIINLLTKWIYANENFRFNFITYNKVFIKNF